jgi:hypothetical protein
MAAELKIAAFACILSTNGGPATDGATGSSKRAPMFEAVCKTPAMFGHFNLAGKIRCRLAADGGGGNLRLNCKL